MISEAAGTYVLTLNGDADVVTELTVQPGQNVIISGESGYESPSWGSGGFTVGVRAQLSLSSLVLGESNMIAFFGAAGTVSLSSLTMPS